MYPFAIRLERRCSKDYKLPGSEVVIKKDTLVSIPAIAIQRDPEIYPEPERFDPDRFTAEARAARNPYTYMPFGHGPRNCNTFCFMDFISDIF